MADKILIKRALLSVSDKTGLAEFAKKLSEFGIELISTGGTAKILRAEGLQVKDVSEVTGFPEMMDGRVKTLHPKIHGALLGVRSNPAHIESMSRAGIEPIDLVVVNLYPFEKVSADSGSEPAEIIENIDIGGPAMIRSAAKNFESVAVVTEPKFYNLIIEELLVNNGALGLETRRNLALLAFAKTASYDLNISSWLATQLNENDLSLLEEHNPLSKFQIILPSPQETEPAQGAPTEKSLPQELVIEAQKSLDLRYGENPHQRAALYSDGTGYGAANAVLLSGKQMSFNNFIDLDAAIQLVAEFSDPAAVIIKHTNPAGAAIGSSPAEAYSRALSCDPVSAFGGIVAFNRRLDARTANRLTEIFLEIVAAPSFDEDALELLKSKKNLRILQVEFEDNQQKYNFFNNLEVKQISGGYLLQDRDHLDFSPEELKVVTQRQPTEDELNSMLFAWKVAKHTRSNAIVIADRFQTLGVGAGQMNRVDSIRIAGMRANRYGLKTDGAALASDAFFPFRDNVDEAVKLGISAIIQPGGSLRDDESIQAANEHGIVMAFTGFRHFKH